MIVPQMPYPNAVKNKPAQYKLHDAQDNSRMGSGDKENNDHINCFKKQP